MNILLVAATSMECLPLCKRLERDPADLARGYMPAFHGVNLKLLVTGVGMVNAGIALGRELALEKPDVAVQMGVGGAFEGGPAMGEVVEIVEEIYPELGADSPQGFLPLSEMGFAHFTVGETAYHNVLAQPRAAIGTVAGCRGVTVNRVSGEATAIQAMRQRWEPQVESMEGAAFFQACLLAGVPFRQFRAISNRVEPRNRAGWRMQEAIAALNQTVWDLFTLADEKRIDL